MSTNGSHWLLLVGGSTIADKIVCETSASIDLTKDTIEVTCKDSVWKKYIDGFPSHDMSLLSVSLFM